MQHNPKRRSKLTGLAMRGKNWDLEDLRHRQRAAVERFESAATAARELAQEIEQSHAQLSQAMNGERSLDLHTIEATRAYILERSNLHKQCVADVRRAAQDASQVDIQVRHAALTVRALEQVKHQADQEIRKRTETRLAELDIELWLQSALAAGGAAGENDD